MSQRVATKDNHESPPEQAMQQTCEKCGTIWIADEFLKCPVCKCPPHDWTKDGETCAKCGIKDWMT